MANLDQLLAVLGPRFGVLAESSTSQLTVIARNSDVAIGDLFILPCRRGPDRMPLKEKDWNAVVLTLDGDTVTLTLNGTEVYARRLEATNQRLFGLFHDAGEAEARVQALTYRGRWPGQPPGDLLRPAPAAASRAPAGGGPTSR